MFFASGAEPEEIAEPIEVGDDRGRGGFAGGGEGCGGAFGASGDAACHFEPCCAREAAGSGGGPAFEAVGEGGFLFCGFCGEAVDVGAGDGGEASGGVAFGVFGASGEHAHDGDEVVLGSGDDGADVVALDGDSCEAEGGVEFIGVADGVEPGVVLGDPAAEEEVGLAGVAAAGRDGEWHEAQLTSELAAGLLRRCRGEGYQSGRRP